MPLEMITGRVTAAGATLTGLTMSAGDTLTVRSSTRPKLLNAWVDAQGAGTLRIRSPLFHDNVQGIRLDTVVSDAVPLMPMGLYQPLIPQDVVIAELSGSATAGDIESAGLLYHYDMVGGTAGRYIDEAQLRARAVQPFTVENTLALGTGGGYSGEEAINVEFDQFKANYDYALVGYLVDAECAAIGWRGIDTGNLRVGGPGNETLRHVTADWFARLSRLYGLPCIPVLNAANADAFLVDGVQDENGTDVTVTSIFYQLTPEAAKGAAATVEPTSHGAGSIRSSAKRAAPRARTVA